MDPYAGNTSDPQSLHKYLYCHANPVNNIDPTGLFSLAELNAVNSIRCMFTAAYQSGFEGAKVATETALMGGDLNDALYNYFMG
jgi:hypothetical protein